MDREIRQPARMRRAEHGAVVGVGDQEVEVLLGHHRLDFAPALGYSAAGIVGRRTACAKLGLPADHAALSHDIADPHHAGLHDFGIDATQIQLSPRR